MAYLNISVPIPEKRITFKKSKNANYRYVYTVVKKLRNKNGTPTNYEKAIGKEDVNRAGYMIPNHNFELYYDLPKKAEEIEKPIKVSINGGVTFLNILSKKFNLDKILEEVFGEFASDILNLAIYMCLNDNVMMNVNSFFESSSLEDVNLSSSRISYIFSRIDLDMILNFFKLWKENIFLENETVVYDVTSISTYANHELAEYGYNRDKEELPQVNLAMLYAAKTSLPLAYSLYSGSIPDKTFFSHSINLSKYLGAENSLYVMDRGFYTKENLKLIKDLNINVLIAVSKSLKNFKEVMKNSSDRIRKSQYHIAKNVFGIKNTVSIDNEDYSLFSYLNTKSQIKEEESIYHHIEELEKELIKESKVHKKTRYNKYYDVELAEESVVKGFKINHEKIDENMKLVGMFSLLSNNKKYSPKEALKIYSQRDVIEKVFDGMKNQLGMERMLTHNQSTTQGKLFTNFIALILWSHLTNKLSENKEIAPSVENMLLIMNKIKTLSYRKANYLLEPLTKKQKDILELLEIEKDAFLEDLTRRL